MSTEQFNNESTPLQIDPERESELLAFAQSMNDHAQTTNKGKSKRQIKWVTALKRRFNRRSLTLIASSAATVLLAVVMVVVMLCVKDDAPIGDTTQQTDDAHQQTETTQVVLLDKTQPTDQTNTSNKSHLLQADIQNADDTFTIQYDETAKTYILKEYEDIVLSNQLLQTLRYYTETIAAVEEVKNASSLDVYGLDDPDATASFTYSDGTSARLFLGDKTPSGNGYYGQLEGTTGVYIFNADSVALFRLQSTAFADTTLITPPSVKEGDTDGQALLKEITYTGTAHLSPLVMRRSNPSDSEDLSYFSYVIEKPYLRCTTDEVSSALSSMQTISAKQALYLHPTEEEKQKLGFGDNPLIQINATMAVETEEQSTSTDSESARPKIYYNSINYQLTIGSVDSNGNYIAMLDGIDAIFLIEKASYEFVLGRTYQNSVNEYLFFKHINSLERIEVEVKGDKYEFHLTHYPEKEETNDQLTVKVNGKLCSTEEFRELYELIMALERHDAPDTEPSGNVALTLSLYEPNDKLYLSAKYYETSATMCTVETSEGELLTTLWGDVAFFIQQVENYVNGKDVLIRN